MKKTAYYFLFLAAIVAGGLTSCQDDDMGFTKEEVKASVYEREFIKAFGQPAANHTWGFDAQPFAVYDLDYVNSISPSTRAIETFDSEEIMKKYDQVWANEMHVRQCLELPAIISNDEHEEVSAWFRNHVVYWANPTTNAENEHSKDFLEGKGAIAYEKEAGFDYGSLSDYKGNVEIITSFSVNWAFVQHVSKDYETEYYKNNSHPNDEHCWDQNEINPDTGKKEPHPNGGQDGWYKTTPCSDNGTNMSELRIKPTYDNRYCHLKDFNNGGYVGWPCDDDTQSNNGDLIFNVDFNDMIYKSSVDSKWHNKYIIVYLKGHTKDGVPYEGYYLGMDLEGEGPGGNQTVRANGVCDDWIVKLTIPTAKIVQGEPRRIMCEDLGGVYDYDFNDIVIDVTPSTAKHDNGNSGNKDIPYLEVKLQALGGTLPIYATYEDHALWGSAKQDLHEKFTKGPGYPVNVSNLDASGTLIDNSKNGAYRGSLEVARIVKRSDLPNGNINWTSYKVNLSNAIVTDGDIDYKKIHIYVKPSSEAEWIQLANFAGIAPLKIIVPQTVGWAIECAGMPGTKTSPKSKEQYEKLSSGRSIGCAYPGFMNWVNDPSVLFWNGTKADQYIYKP